MNQIVEAKAGRITEEVARVAALEGVEIPYLQEKIIAGEVVIVRSQRFPKPEKLRGVGAGLSTKVNANIGTSRDVDDLACELEKLRVSEQYGADMIMDLSTGGDIEHTRKRIIEASNIPVGSVPVYDVMHSMLKQGKNLQDATEEDFLHAIQRHIDDGVDFITVHCGVTQDVLQHVQTNQRIMGVVSRGGSYLCDWMHANKKENPLYTCFDEIVAMAKKYDVCLSLGDGLRPGALADATDSAQIAELMILGELQQRSLAQDVQVFIEGPGHVPIDQIETNIKLQKRLCHNAPFYVLGPLVTDIAPGYDHITAAIGGAIAASAGADFLCYVTPAEHLRLPNLKDVKEGVIATKIAAHAADVAKFGAKARRRDDDFSRYRMTRDWDKQISCGLDPEKAQEYRDAVRVEEKDTCSMCGAFCSAKMNERFLNS